MKKLVLFSLFLLLISRSGFAYILEVPSEYPNIQSAINAANVNDTVLISGGTYFENLLIEQAIVLCSHYVFTQDTNYIEQTIIDGNANGTVVTIKNIAEGSVEIIGLTITGGNGTLADPHGYGSDFIFGGGFFIENCDITELNHLKITGNILTTEHNGAGGIYAFNTNLSILGCNISNNMVNGGSLLGEGAGAFIYNSNAYFTQTKIVNNTGGQVYGDGGGIYANTSFLSISNTLISENSCVNAGGIYAYFLTGLEMDNVSVRDNIAEFSAGLYNYNDEVIPCSIIDCDFTSNTSNNSGGAVSLFKVDALITNLSVKDNEGGNSNGGISFSYSDVEMDNSEVLRNTSSSGIGGDAAGILSYHSNLQLFDVLIDSNVCLNSTHFNEGGGINIRHGSLYMERVTITNNIADQGAAIRASSTSIEMRNCLIANNSALYEGGIFYCYDTEHYIINSTLADNYAGNSAIYSRGNYFMLLNSILWNPSETEVFFHTEFNDESYMDIAYSDIRGNDQYIVTNNYGEVIWHDGNINENPVFVDPASFDYSLQEGSPLIDAGTAYFELDGEIIIDYDVNDYSGLAPDMGAFEYEFVTGTGQYVQKEYFNVFPNPCNDYLTISMENELINKAVIKLFSTDGELVNTKLLEKNEKATTLNVSGIAPGAYILNIIDNNHIYYKKLLKN